MRGLVILAIVFSIDAFASSTLAADNAASLTISVYPCAQALRVAPSVEILARPRVPLMRKLRQNAAWIFTTALPSGYYTVTARSERCSGTIKVAILPGVPRAIGIVEQATTPLEKHPASGGLAGTIPAPGLRIFIKPIRGPTDSGTWAAVDGRHFYVENLEQQPYRLVVHFGNCCGFTQDVSVRNGALTVVRLDLSRFYDQAFAQRMAESSLYGLVLASDGTPWFAESIGVYTRIGHINRRGLLEEHQLKTRGSIFSLTPRPDGSVWFLAGPELDELTPAGQVIQVAIDHYDRFTQLIFAGNGSVWITGMSNSTVLHYNPATGRTHAYTLPFVPSGSENAWLSATSDGSVWYTSLGGNRIIRFGPDETETQRDLTWNCGPHRLEEWNNARIFSCWDGTHGAGMIDAAGQRAWAINVPATNDASVAFPAQLDGTIWFIDRKGSAFVGLDADGRQRILPQKPPLYAFGLVAANHRLWFTDNPAKAIISVGLDGTRARFAYPRTPPDDTNLPPVDQLVPDSNGNVWFIARRDLALYRIGTDGRLDRLPVHPRPAETLR